MEYLRRIFCQRRKSHPEEGNLKDLNSDQKEEKIPSQFQIWKFYFKFIKIDWKSFVTRNLNWITCSVLQSYAPFILINIKQSLLEEDYDLIKQQLCFYLLCQVLVQILHFSELKNHWNASQEMKQSIQKSILEHLFSLDIQFFEDNKVSYLSNLVQEGSDQICEQISYGKITKKLNKYTEVISQLVFIYYQNPHIIALIFSITTLHQCILYRLNKKKKMSEKNSDYQSEYKNFALDDIITNIHLIKIFRREKKEIENLDCIIKQNDKYQQETEYYAQVKCMITNCSVHAMRILVVLMIVISGLQKPENKYIIANSLAEIITYIFCSFTLTKDIAKLIIRDPSKYYNEKYKYIGKVMKLFEVQPTITDNQSIYSCKPIQYLQGNIQFENVSFKYPKSQDFLLKMKQLQKQIGEESIQTEDSSNVSSDLSLEQNLGEQNTNLLVKNDEQKQERNYVLKNISFEIKPGQLVAFVGMSGSGKSTLVKLLERYYDIQEGNILFDGVNIKDISLDDLRGSIGLVNQEPSLFDNDIEYNITYGCPDGQYNQEELRQVCDVSGVSEFAFDKNRFPEGLKTLVGSKGMKLSGGQKQRIAIARALIKKPSILILDEATSSLDAESEHLVQKYIDQLVGYRGIIIIVIAHRLSTIVKSDIIYVMENGEIREKGNHQYLIEQEGVYKKLIHHQIQLQN